MLAALGRDGVSRLVGGHVTLAMRVSISNWSTTQSDVDRSIAAVLAAAR